MDLASGETDNQSVDNAPYEVPQRAHNWAPYANRDQLLIEISERLAAGEPLISICRDSHMPNWRTAYDWIAADDEIAAELARARDVGHDSIAADALQIADDRSGDPQRDKLRIDTRLKLLAKWNPKRYGESTQLRHADADGGKLDTAPLVGELLGLMQPGAANTATPDPQPAARAIVQPAPRVSYREVAPAAAPPAQHNAQTHPQERAGSTKPAYRPRAARDDVGDLV